METFGFIGSGNMGSALIRGLLKSGKATPESITIFDPDINKVSALESEFSINSANEVQSLVSGEIDYLFLTVKPQVISVVLNSIANFINESTILVSVAAGISTEFMLKAIGKPAKLIRAMPNAPAMVGYGITAVCKGGSADGADLVRVKDLFDAVGTSVIVDEKLMNAVTGLSGSGPGYLFPIMEAFTDAGVLMGLDRPTARSLTIWTILGSAIMAQSGESFSDLKAKITSPGGTTIAGLQVLEGSGLRGIIMDVVEAAVRKSSELEAK